MFCRTLHDDAGSDGRKRTAGHVAKDMELKPPPETIAVGTPARATGTAKAKRQTVVLASASFPGTALVFDPAWGCVPVERDRI